MKIDEIRLQAALAVFPQLIALRETGELSIPEPPHSGGRVTDLANLALRYADDFVEAYQKQFPVSKS